MRNAFIVSLTCVGIGFGCSSSGSPGGAVDASTLPVDASTAIDSGSAIDAPAAQDTGPCPSPGQVLCGAVCCDATAVCVDDGTGNRACASTCQTSSDCPPAKGCCAVIPGLTSTGACLQKGATIGQQCRCTAATECPTGCCAPSVDGSGNPVKPYVCKAADNSTYSCCVAGNVACGVGGADCCVTVGTGTTLKGLICEKPCQFAADCGSATCQPLTTGMCGTKLGSCVPN